MSKDKENDDDKETLEDLVFEDIKEKEKEKALISGVQNKESKPYKPKEEDLKTLDDIIRRYPNQNPLDILNALKLIESDDKDREIFEEILQRIGLID